MRKIIILITSVILFVSISCDKDDVVKEDPNDILLEINVGNEILYEDCKEYVVLTNDYSDTKYIEIKNETNYILTREDDFRGDNVHIHVISYEPVLNKWYIDSYLNIEKGRTLKLGSFSEDKKSTRGYVYLKFTDIPAYDIVTRSAMHPLHAHTQTSFDVPCSVSDLYQSDGDNFKFYVCLQNETAGKYLIEDIPLDATGDYTISLNDLNTNMSKYSFPKINDDKTLNHLQINATDANEDIVQIYNYWDSDIFNNNIIAFIPTSEFVSYSTTIDYYDDALMYYESNTISGAIPTNFTKPDASLNVTTDESGFPQINIEGNYNFIEYTTSFSSGSWKCFTDSKNDIQLPVLPDDIEDASSYNEMINNIKFVRIEVLHYPESNNTYLEFINDLLIGENTAIRGNIELITGFKESFE